MPLIGWNFSTFSLKLIYGIKRHLRGRKIATSSTMFVFIGPIGKECAPPLIGLNILDFLSETAERNSTKLDRKQDRNVIYQVYFLGLTEKPRLPPSPLVGLDIFDFSETTEQNSAKLDKKQEFNVFSKVCSGRSENKMTFSGVRGEVSDLLRHYWLHIVNKWTEFNNTWQETSSRRPLSSVCISVRSANQDGRPVCVWLRHFQLLLWHRWTSSI